MKCDICKTDHLPDQLQNVRLGQDNFSVCYGCIQIAVGELVADLEQWRKDFCKTCTQSTGSGGCLQRVTPETCA